MNDVGNILGLIPEPPREPEDYIAEDGLLYCGKCHTPKQFRMDEPPFEGRLLPCLCQCQRERREREDAQREKVRHIQAVAELKRRGFTEEAMCRWTFENDNGKSYQLKHARFYVAHWERMKAENIGYLLWGGVGTGKSYFAGCIANALMEREVSVRMTNLAVVLNDLSAGFEKRNDTITGLCRTELLIIDDFGMERGTEYSLEQVYNVIDSRYRSAKPLIVTTNLPLTELQNPQDTAHARIYDRLLAMCAPIRFTGESFRKVTAQEKLAKLKDMLKE